MAILIQPARRAEAAAAKYTPPPSTRRSPALTPLLVHSLACSLPATPAMLQLGNAWTQSLDPTLLAYAVNAVVVGGYLHYVVVMINEICGFLGIPCLTVRKVAE